MKRISASFIILLLLPVIILAQSYEWREIETPTSSAVSPIGIKSSSDFWIYEDNGELFHYKDGTWYDYILEKGSQFNLYKFVELSKNTFIVSSIAADWHTNFYKFLDNKWIKYNFEWKYPAQGFVVNNKNEIFSFGNFGTILKLSEDNWNYIDNPIENHINDAIATSGDSIWFATTTQGVFLYHSDEFHQFTIDSNKQPIISLHRIRNNIYARTHKDLAFKFDGYKFDKIPSEATPWYIKEKERKLGLSLFLSHQDASHKELISFPSDYSISRIKRINDNEFIATTTDGGVFLANKTNSPIFYNLAEAYQIKGNKNQNIIGSGICDLNNDKINDILFIASGNNQYLYIYEGSLNAPYSFVTPSTGLKINEYNYSFTTGDLTNDQFPELIFQRKDVDKYALVVFQNNGDFYFTEKHKIKIDENLQTYGIRDLRLFDYNNDGYNDLVNMYYYGPKDEKGYVEILKNNFFSNSFESDTTLKSESRIWNEHTIIGDFDNNDLCDLMLLNRWGDDVLLYQYEDGWKNVTKEKLNFRGYAESEAGCAFDFDNDADLDVVIVENGKFLTLLENVDGNYFIDKSDELISKIHTEVAFKDGFKRTVCVGDFNNDGYQDLFTSVYDLHTHTNILLENNAGKVFVDKTELYNLGRPYVKIASVGDIDNDGDLDIIGSSRSETALFVNQVNDSNFIKIKLIGSIATADALFAKVYLYDAGYINQSKYLAGFRQSGSDKFSPHQNNDLTIHFGAPKSQYDIVVKFYNGNTIEKIGVRKGQSIEIREVSNMMSMWYAIPSKFFKLVISREFQSYSLLILLAFICLFYGTKFGHVKYGWDSKLTTIFGVVNISLFWVVFYLASSSDVLFVKYVLPFTILAAGVAIPIIVFFWIDKTKIRYKSINNINEELLLELINFSHGQWALRNLNSISLLCKNIPADYLTNTKFSNQFNERKNTYEQLTSNVIEKIALLAKETGYDNSQLNELKYALSSTSINVALIPTENGKNVAREISKSIDTIIGLLEEIKNRVMKDFSCDPIAVVKNVTDEFDEKLKKNNVELIRYNNLTEHNYILIKSNELADIIDNLLSNSLKSFQADMDNLVEISIYNFAPKIVIEFKNNGRVIQMDKFEKIFEQGYSESGGTGHGLSYSRKIIQKYGGRFYLAESTKENGTIFRIELNQGVIR